MYATTLINFLLFASGAAALNEKRANRFANIHRRHVHMQHAREQLEQQAPVLAKRAQFSGMRATYYDTGLGACGIWNAPGDYIVALNTPQYGGGYPGPNCFRMINIYYGGQTVQAQVTDQCPGCPYGGLDFSQGLMERFVGAGNALNVGVITMDWDWADGASAPAPAPPAPAPAPPAPAPAPPAPAPAPPAPAPAPPAPAPAPPAPAPAPSSEPAYTAPTSTSDPSPWTSQVASSSSSVSVMPSANVSSNSTSPLSSTNNGTSANSTITGTTSGKSVISDLQTSLNQIAYGAAAVLAE